MTSRRLLPLALLLAIAAFVGGCGGDSGSDEPTAADATSAYAPIRAQLVTLGGDIGTAITNARNETDVQLAAAFTALAASARTAVARLDDVQVPESLVAERNALRDAVEQGTGDLSDIATAARANDAAAARAAAQQLIADSAQIRVARSEFERALDAAK